MPGTHKGPPGLTRRKVGMTSNHHAPYVQGFTHATMAGTAGCDGASRSGSRKTGLSSDRSLQPGSVKVESLVIADQQRRGECVPGPCTHRPSSHESGQHPKPVAHPLVGGSGRRWGSRLGLSRNKVAVPEGAAGSPPFYGENATVVAIFMERSLLGVEHHSFRPVWASNLVQVTLLGSPTATVGALPLIPGFRAHGVGAVVA